MAITDDVDANATAIVDAVDRAAAEGAEILLTPEGSLSGYTHLFDQDAVQAQLYRVTAHARSSGIGLALGTCFVEDDGRCYNQVRMYRPDGAYLGFHSKILRCGTFDTPPVGEINHYAVTNLRTFDWNGLTVGALICNDMWANPQCTPMDDPHLTVQLAHLGARVVFHAVHGGRNGSEWSAMTWAFHESNLRMRAQASSVWIVTVDCATPEDLPCSAPSGVIGPDGAFVERAPEKGSQLFVCDIPT